MANTIVKVYTTVAAKLSQLAVSSGQLIFVRDTRKIYLDFNGSRVCYDAIAAFDTDQERLDWLAPTEGFYFVKSTGVLWSYEGSWKQLTPDNLDQVVFGDLPQTGNSKLLYVTDDVTYKWDSGKGEYKPVSNLTEWTTL